MDINAKDTALVITDPENDFLSPDGVTWGLVGKSVEENGTIAHIEELLKAAKGAGCEVLVSPHYYYPTDRDWQFGGTVEKMMHEIGMFDRSGALTTDGFDGSGARSTSRTSRNGGPWVMWPDTPHAHIVVSIDTRFEHKE